MLLNAIAHTLQDWVWEWNNFLTFLTNFLFLLQGASATFPSFYCDIKQDQLKNHGKKAHNFETVQCKERSFDDLKVKFKEQVECLGEGLISEVDNFAEFVVINGRNDIERKFRDFGKHHKSLIGQNNSAVDSIDFMCGGCLHNEIGLVNDCLDNLFKGLKRQKFENVCEVVKSFLDSAKSDGGLGCTPAQYHGGQYNGRDALVMKVV